MYYVPHASWSHVILSNLGVTFDINLSGGWQYQVEYRGCGHVSSGITSSCLTEGGTRTERHAFGVGTVGWCSEWGLDSSL